MGLVRGNLTQELSAAFLWVALKGSWVSSFMTPQTSPIF